MNISYHTFGPLNPAVKPPLPAPLLLINGYGSTQYDWPFQFLETLAADREVFIFDNPRIGMSTDNSSTFLSVEYMANATLGFIQALGLTNPDIVGYSMGGYIALTLAANHSDMVGSVVSISSSFGGSTAPQPPAGLAAVVLQLEKLFLAKYQNTTAVNVTMSAFLQPQSASATSPSPSQFPTNSTNSTNALMQEYELLFPLGWLDPGMCTLVHDYVSLGYAVGLLPLDNYTGYALPGHALAAGIIPSISALIPTPAALAQQTAAVLQYNSGQNGVKSSLSQTSHQILVIGGVQDNVIPSSTQSILVGLAPATWLQQIPAAGHGLPFLDPVGLAGNITSFLGSSHVITSSVRSYYQAPATSSAPTAHYGVLAVILLMAHFLTKLLLA